MKRLSLACGLLLAVALAGPASAEPIGLEDLGTGTDVGSKMTEVKDAVTRFRNRDFDGALELLKKASEKSADVPPAEVMMAQLYAAANQANLAVGMLEQAIKEAPNDPEAFVILGDLDFRNGRPTPANMMYSKALAMLPEFKGSARRKKLLTQRVNAGMASVAEVRQDWAAAQKHLEAWLAEDPDNAIALQRTARALFQQNKADEALQKLQEAKKANDQVLTPQATLAQWYETAGDRDNAAKMMVAALEAEPDVLATRLAAAQWSFNTEQYDQAKQQADIALQLDDTSVPARLLSGVIALFLKDNKTAEQHFEQAHLMSPANFAAINNLALALAEQEEEAKKRKALEYARLGTLLGPNSAEAFSTLGWVLYRLGRIDEAEQALGKAASSGQLSPDTAYYIARVSVDRNNSQQARNLLETALKAKRPFSKRQEAEALLEQLK